VVSAAETIASGIGKYADKEWNQFLHTTTVGQVVDQDLKWAKGFVGAAGDFMQNQVYGLGIKPYTDPMGWLHDCPRSRNSPRVAVT
jgi:hypothetical protein